MVLGQRRVAARQGDAPFTAIASQATGGSDAPFTSRATLLGRRAAMANHSTVVQRLSDKTWVSIPAFGKVKPGEIVRYRTDGFFPGFFIPVYFRAYRVVGDVLVEKVFEQQVKTTLNGQAWIDTVAPAQTGYYIAWVWGSNPVGTSHTAISSVFEVAVDAPAPPAAPPSGGIGGIGEGIGGAFDDLFSTVNKTLLIVAGVVLVAAVAPAIARRA